MKMFIKTAIIVLVFFVGFQVVYAVYGQVFGGRITTVSPSEVPEIETVKSAGYICQIPGTTIQVQSVKRGLQSFLIPHGITAKTRTTPTMNQKIIGKYVDYGAIIICTHPETGSTQTVSLPNITLFGTSRI